MDIDKVLNLATNISSKKIVDRVEWITSTIKLLKEIKEEYAKKYFIINRHLETRILDPEFLALFESYPVDGDRLALLLNYYGAKTSRS